MRIHVLSDIHYKTQAGARVVCNPRGYWPDDLNPAFDPGLVVEVR